MWITFENVWSSEAKASKLLNNHLQDICKKFKTTDVPVLDLRPNVYNSDLT